MSYIFSICIILGYLGVIKKNRLGFIAQSLGCIGMLLLYYGVDGGVVLVNTVFLFVNIYGFYRWRKDDCNTINTDNILAN